MTSCLLDAGSARLVAPTPVRIRALEFRVLDSMTAAPALDRVLSVMIPAFNAERTLELILKHVLERPAVGEVIAVDAGATDATWAIMSRCAERASRVGVCRQG